MKFEVSMKAMKRQKKQKNLDETRTKIENLQNIYDNMTNINNAICLSDIGEEMARNVEELCNLNNTLRNLAASTAQYANAEIKRLEKIIEKQSL